MNLHQKISEIVKEFEQNYISEWRWEREAPSKPSAGDAMKSALLSIAKLTAEEMGKALEIEELEVGYKICSDDCKVENCRELMNVNSQGYNSAVSEISRRKDEFLKEIE